MVRMAIGTGDAVVRMRRRSPLSTGSTRVLFVAGQADFRSFGSRHPLETQDRIRLPAPTFQVAAGWPVTRLAPMIAMHIVGERFHMHAVTHGTQRVFVDIVGVGDLRLCDVNRRICPGLPRLPTARPAVVQTNSLGNRSSRRVIGHPARCGDKRHDRKQCQRTAPQEISQAVSRWSHHWVGLEVGMGLSWRFFGWDGMVGSCR